LLRNKQNSPLFNIIIKHYPKKSSKILFNLSVKKVGIMIEYLVPVNILSYQEFELTKAPEEIILL
jgi:hypothetical protein